jgi:7,8-dihydropterin-6-yl-methyl-4-(beta-D-ribofuranosyl)aminobenzene 5'-phosphate synthase
MNSDPISITVLVDNEAGEGLNPEHGLSLWIEAGGKRILFDTGQGNVLVENARRLGVPLEKTDILVLSHGHYDHTGGVANVLGIAPRMRLVLHPGALIERYSLPRGKPAKPVGMPPSARTAIDRAQDANIIWALEPLALASNIGVTGPIPRVTFFEDVGGPFFLDPQGKQKDAIVDDQALWLVSPEGLIVCLGCSHAGLVNSLAHVRRLSGNIPIRAVIGGFHLLHADDHRIDRTLEALQWISPGLLVPCHCTGKQAIEAFKDKFEHVDVGSSGLVFRFQ